VNTTDENALILQMFAADPRCRRFGAVSSTTILFVSKDTLAALRRQGVGAPQPARRLPERTGIKLTAWLDCASTLASTTSRTPSTS